MVLPLSMDGGGTEIGRAEVVVVVAAEVPVVARE